MPWKLPKNCGRTVRYLVFRACERFHQPVAWFYTLDRAEQLDYLGYEDLRETEEAGDVED